MAIVTTYPVNSDRYIADLFAQHDEVLKRVWEDTPKYGLPAINIQPEEGRFLQFLVRACGALRALEIGTLGGYSSIWIVRGLPPGGRLITLEKDPYNAEIALRNFELAGLSEQIELRVGEALTSLELLADSDDFDFIFIDADKANYEAYFEWSLAHLRPGGILAYHNALMHGKVPLREAGETNVEIMRALNQRVALDPALTSIIYPAGDGTLIMVKNP